ncbi:MAG: transporter substrate-binding domain-containing protein [Clostridia bacterium]|nr:transporter substrate-binding domain-containing protein [Clostridia bacterium]
MKKFMAVALATIAACATLSFAACGNNDKYVATPIASDANEQYAFAIGKNASKKTEILNAMNKVIDEIEIADVVDYYDAIANEQTPAKTLDFANLSDNTAGTLQVYTNAEFAPFEFRDEKNNIVGVDMYVMELVAEELNMKISFNDIAFDAIVGKVETEDNAIGAAGMTVTEERLEKVDFSNTYFSTVQCIISKDTEAFATLEDLKGKKIGVQKGTTGWFLIDEAITNGILKDTGAEVVQYDNGAVAFTALKSTKCDVVVIDELPAKKLVK